MVHPGTCLLFRNHFLKWSLFNLRISKGSFLHLSKVTIKCYLTENILLSFLVHSSGCPSMLQKGREEGREMGRWGGVGAGGEKDCD